MRKIIIIAILTLFLIAGCLQQPITPAEPTTPIEEPTVEEPEQICTEMWLCKDENTKAYRKSDCTFEQITDCPAGCENAECKEEIVEEPPTEEIKEETKESCTIGFKCLDKTEGGIKLQSAYLARLLNADMAVKMMNVSKQLLQRKRKKKSFL